jgi:AraC-like DNA-binding protein
MSKRTARRYRRATASARQHSAVPISKAATPIAFVQTILRAYEKYNADPAEALRRARIAPGDLRRSEARVTSAQLETLTDFAMRELDDEALGWFSRKLPWGSYGMLCRASLTAPNLGIALKRWCRHHRLLTDDIVIELSITAGTARLAIRENRRLEETRELCLLTSLRYPQGYASWVIDSRIPLQRVDFPFQTPRHAAVYALLFQAPVRFGAAQAAITFDAQYLSLPLRRDETALRNMLRCALPLTVRRYRSDRLVIQKLRAVLRTHRTDLRSGESVASALNLSLRTLHRRLAEEGTSLQQVKNEVRRDQAAERLVRTLRSIKQIARDVGFRNEKSFMRAFRQWMGESPAQYRRKANAQP